MQLNAQAVFDLVYTYAIDLLGLGQLVCQMQPAMHIRIYTIGLIYCGLVTAIPFFHARACRKQDSFGSYTANALRYYSY